MKTRERASGRSDRSIPAFLHGYLPTQRTFHRASLATEEEGGDEKEENLFSYSLQMLLHPTDGFEALNVTIKLILMCTVQSCLAYAFFDAGWLLVFQGNTNLFGGLCLRGKLLPDGLDDVQRQCGLTGAHVRDKFVEISPSVVLPTGLYWTGKSAYILPQAPRARS